MDWLSIFNLALGELISPITAVFVMCAIGLSVHFGYTGLLNFGQSGFLAVAAYGLGVSIAYAGWSLWVGILVGIGFYPAAILLTLLSASLMMWGAKLEMRLPSRRAVGATLTFAEGHRPDEHQVRQAMRTWGYLLADGSLQIVSRPGHLSWQFVMVANCSEPPAATLFELERHWRDLPGVAAVQLAHARN
mgnify:CR=1 FL=1